MNYCPLFRDILSVPNFVVGCQGNLQRTFKRAIVTRKEGLLHITIIPLSKYLTFHKVNVSKNESESEILPDKKRHIIPKNT